MVIFPICKKENGGYHNIKYIGLNSIETEIFEKSCGL